MISNNCRKYLNIFSVLAVSSLTFHLPQSVAATSMGEEFSLRVFRTLLKQSNGEDNLVFSPYAMRHALGMAATGARGRTQKQLFTVSRGGDPLANASTKKNSNLKVLLGSRLWVQTGFPLLESFMATTETTYGDRPWMVDFTKAPDFLKERVNGWVEEKTLGKIRNFISEESVDPTMKVLLSSALYFKGDWAKKFDPARTQSAEFSALNSKTKEVISTKFLRATGNYLHYKNSDVQVLEIPYSDSEMAMDIFLPVNPSGLDAISESLDSETVGGEWLSHLTLKEVSLSLPKFEMDSNFELSETLKAIGIVDPFLPGTADFSGMNGKKELSLSKMNHKTMISVNELGTESSSAAVGNEPSRGLASSGVPFEANHPFLFGVRHRNTNTFILLGRLVKPVLPVYQD